MGWVGDLREVLRTDLERNDYPLSRLTLFTFRLGQARATAPGPLRLPVRVLYKVLDRFALQLLLGVDLPAEVTAGPGLRLPHAGRGLVVHPRVRLGQGVTLYHGVTIGVRGTPDEAPVLGDDVYVGTGACILGAVELGDGCSVGANAVVLQDVPPGALAVGVPAAIRGAGPAQ